MQLQTQIEAFNTELESSKSEISTNSFLLEKATERQAILEAKSLQIGDNIRNIKAEILKCEFQIAKLKETAPEIPEPSNDSEIQQLKAQAADADDRLMKVSELVDQVHEECTSQIMKVEEETRIEIETMTKELDTLKVRNSELNSSLRVVESSMRESIDNLEYQKKQIESQGTSIKVNDDQMLSLKSQINKVEEEILKIDNQIKEKLEIEKMKREELDRIKKEIQTKTETYENRISKSKSSLKIQYKEMKHLEKKVDELNNRNGELKKIIDDANVGRMQRPNYSQMLKEEKEKMEKEFLEMIRIEQEKQESIIEKQKEMDKIIFEKKNNIEQFSYKITKCAQEARKRAELSHQERKKIKLLKTQMKTLESELEELRNETLNQSSVIHLSPKKGDNAKKIIPPPIKTQDLPQIRLPSPSSEKKLNVIKELSDEMEELDQQLSNSQKEIESLQFEEDELSKEIKRLKDENHSMEESLQNFDDIIQFHSSLKRNAVDMSSIPKPKKKQNK